ncbi:AAA family ATPase [Algivirga pacifica]|uniref:Cytidylate kinase n=1 Tax=Algivirga pacifica TaxID=1162670 RepID=A0ABP9DCK6_9BACT
MESLTYEYFQHYFEEEQVNRPPFLKCNGFAVAISRDYGCDAMGVALSLMELLNADKTLSDNHKQWEIVDSEVIRQVGKELKLNTDKVTEISTANPGVIDQILKAFDAYDKDEALFKALRGVIDAYMQRGNVIFVGRGAGFYGQKIPNVLNVRLVGDLEYRIHALAQKQNITLDESRKTIREQGAKRERFIQMLSGETDVHYDLVMDREVFTTVGTAHFLKEALKAKKEEYGKIKGE